MTQNFYQLFELVTYPCYWLSKSGEFWMNDAAKNAVAPLSNPDSVRHILKTASRIATYTDNTPFALPVLTDALRHQTLSLLPLPDGMMATAVNHLETPMAAFSNQLREPLTNIFAVLPLLNKKLEDCDIRYTEEIQQNCYDLLRLTSNLESIGQLEAKKLPTRTVDLAALIESIGFSAESVCRSHGVTIDAIVPSHPVPVQADAHLLSESILNIIRNSLQYTQDGNHVTIRLSERKGKAIVSINDKGMGIKSEYLEYIFEPYFSSEPYGDGAPRPGLGLGLTVVRESINHFGGTLTAESRFGEGSTISFSLPVSSSENDMLGSDPTDYLLNRYSPVYVQLSGICRLPNL